MSDLLVHPKFTDVAFTIEDSRVEHDRAFLEVTWWNTGRCHSPYCMFLSETLNVPKEWVQQLRPYTWDPSLPEAKRSILA